MAKALGKELFLRSYYTYAKSLPGHTYTAVAFLTHVTDARHFHPVLSWLQPTCSNATIVYCITRNALSIFIHELHVCHQHGPRSCRSHA